MASVSPLRIKTLDSNVRVSMIGLLTVAPSEHESRISDFVADFGLYLQGDKVVLIDAGRNDERVAELLSWNPRENGGGRLFVEVQLRDAAERG